MHSVNLMEQLPRINMLDHHLENKVFKIKPLVGKTVLVQEMLNIQLEVALKECGQEHQLNGTMTI